jgi:hypothetical protein
MREILTNRPIAQDLYKYRVGMNRFGALFFCIGFESNMPYSQIIPQVLYSVTRPYTRLPDVVFEVDGSIGIYLDDALRNQFQGLHDAHGIPTLTHTARKVTLRLNVRQSAT